MRYISELKKYSRLFFILLFISITLLAFSKIIVNNNFAKSFDKYESFYMHYLNLKYDLVDDAKKNINSNEVCQLIKDRKLDRHHLRLFIDDTRVKLLTFFYDKTSSKKLIFYIFTFYIFICTFLTFFFSSILSKNYLLKLEKKNYNKIFIELFLYIFLLSVFASKLVSELRYSFFDMLLVSCAIYFSLKKNFFLFIIICILATLNRESGIVLSGAWFVINGLEFNNKFIPKIKLKHFYISLSSLTLSLVIFLTINWKIFSCGFLPELFFHVDVDNIFIEKFNYISFKFLNSLFINFLLILLICYFFWNSSEIQKKILILIIIYNLIFIIFTPLEHSVLRIFLIPFVLVYIDDYFRQKCN